jgi:hypothetical protein
LTEFADKRRRATVNGPPEGERRTNWFDAICRTHRPLEKQTSLFILVSALDFYMTYLLLSYGEEENGESFFYESNPMARYFLDWGIHGLIAFKFSIVAFVAVIAQVIATRQEHTARALLNFATGLVACVVIYSLTLLLRHGSLWAN